MFSRSFMRTFPVRKYARQTGSSGTINTDIALMGKRDVIPYRIGVFAFISLVMVTAYSGFEFFYETIRHVPGPMHHATWQDSVPESVKGPNEEIINNWNKIHEVKDWIKTIQPPK